MQRAASPTERNIRKHISLHTGPPSGPLEGTTINHTSLHVGLSSIARCRGNHQQPISLQCNINAARTGRPKEPYTTMKARTMARPAARWKELQATIWARILARPAAQCSGQRATGSIHNTLTADVHICVALQRRKFEVVVARIKKQASFRLICVFGRPCMQPDILISWAGYNPVISGYEVWARSWCYIQPSYQQAHTRNTFYTSQHCSQCSTQSMFPAMASAFSLFSPSSSPDGRWGTVTICPSSRSL